MGARDVVTLAELQAMSTTISTDRLIDARVVFLTHYIPLYQVGVLQSIAASVRDFHVLVSTPIEPNREFEPDWSGLDVTVQNTWTLRRRWRDRNAGFEDPLYVHFPYDTSKQLRQLNPDVVMSLELGARSMGAAMYCQLSKSTKLVLCTYMSERTERERGILRKSLRKWLIGRADAITYNGPSCKKYLEQIGAPEDHLFPLPYAADDRTLFTGCVDRDDAATHSRFLVAGQLTQRKGIMPLIQQISRYGRLRPDRKIEIVFAGSGPLQSAIQAQQVPENLRLTVLGNLTPDELSAEMARCGCLLAPTLADEWMLVVNEALHAGLPVIGSIHAQAVTTLIKDGVNGWRYDPNTDGALALALDFYFGQPAQSLRKMRHAARESVRHRTPQWAASGAIDAIRHVLQPDTNERSQ